MTQSITGTADSVTFSFGNGDRVMTKLQNDTALIGPVDTPAFYHVNTGILLQLWKGFIQDAKTDGSSTFAISNPQDGVFARPACSYPVVRDISDHCWKFFDDQFNCPYSGSASGHAFGSGPGDPLTCDYTFDGPNGCQAHGMDVFFGSHPRQIDIVRVKDNSTGVAGFGRNVVQATSILSDSVWGNCLPEIWCNDGGDPRRAMQVKAMMVSGRDENSFFDGLGIVGAGPIGAYTKNYLIANASGYRYYAHSNPSTAPVGSGLVLSQFLAFINGGRAPTLVFDPTSDAVEVQDTSGSIRAEIGNDPGGLGGWDETDQVFIPASV